MRLEHPVAVYNAANNVEAQLICNFLLGAGIEAFAMADVSQVGVWMLGLLPEIHKPQVWVDRDSVAQATEMLQEYERRQSERLHPSPTTGPEIEALCEECGQTSKFPISLQGRVEDCPRCGKTMDVEDVSSSEPWWQEADSAIEPEAEE